MITESERLLARYKENASEADSLGRLIVVRRLKPSEQTKIAGMTSELSGYDEMTNPDGIKIQIPHRMPLQIAASVCMINGDHIPFPRNRAELDAIYDRLDIEGLAAAGKGMMILNPAETKSVSEVASDAPPDAFVEAKN